MNNENNVDPPEKTASEKKTEVVIETELDRLCRDVYRPDMEKFLLFTKMLRENQLYKRAKITHK